MNAKPLRVLIIEDSEQDDLLLRLELERAGYRPEALRVEDLAGVREALAGSWDVVLSDFHLKQFTAIDALRIAKQVGAEVPFIIVSGSPGEDVAVDAMRAGARDYFRKERLDRLGPAIERELGESDARRQRREAEARTRTVERRLHDTVSSAPIPIAMLEGPTYVYAFRNAAHVALFGDREVIGRAHVEAFPEHRGHTEFFERAYRTGRVVECRELQAHVRQDDRTVREVVLNLVAVPVRLSEGGSVCGVTVIMVDATREVELRLRSEQARREAENANRVKDEFLSTLSHELRTPLNAMLGWTLMLRNGVLGEGKRERALDAIEKSARAQTRLIEDLLDISRIVNGKLTVRPRTMDLSRVLDAAVDSVGLAANAKGIALHLEETADHGVVFGDPDRLQQVIWNVLSNAIKFTPAGGRVDLRLTREGQRVVLTVQDTGVGIDRAFLPHVFERFRQADSSTTRSYSGLGLGLAIARQIAELHGGTLHAASAGEGKGSTFTLSLPTMRGADRVADPPGSETPSLAGLSVLVVEDDFDGREVISTALASSGALVRSAGSSSEALALVRQWTPDVLVSDIGLPDEDGYVLVRKIRSHTNTTPSMLPAIALTAYAADDDARAALVAGFQVHVPKPVEPARLARVVANLVLSNRSDASGFPPRPD